MDSKKIIAIFFGILSLYSYAQTPISGDISGTWNISGSPYILTNHCKVPANQKLSINPGVKVIIGENLKITAEGIIEAVGTVDNPIIITAPNETTFWDQINVLYTSTGVSQFHFCRISNAKYGLYLQNKAYTNTAMIDEIYNCTFSNCLNGAIFAEAQGVFKSNYMSAPTAYSPKISPKIQNCEFTNTKNGIILLVHGSRWQHSFGYWYTYGNASPVIANNIFNEVEGIVFKMTVGSYLQNNSFPIFINNNVVNSDTAIYAQLPYDAIVKNNIFKDNLISFIRTGELTSNVYFNCFYNNLTNFIGLPSSYGSVVMNNRNNTPCDVGFNIYVDPLFSNAAFNIYNNSPCIDAGTADSTVNYLPTTDIFGNTRINDGNWDGNIFVDIGACEYISPTSIGEGDIRISKSFKLDQNYPNPFNSFTLINYELNRECKVLLKINNISGFEVCTLVNEVQPQGKYSVTWNGKDSYNHALSSGIYFYELIVDKEIESRKMLLLR